MDMTWDEICQEQHLQDDSDVSFSLGHATIEGGPLSNDGNLRQMPQTVSPFKELTPCHPDDLLTESPTPYPVYKNNAPSSFCPSSYPTYAELNDEATVPSTVDSTHYFRYSRNCPITESSLGYISPPALSTISHDSRSNTYMDNLEILRSVPPSGACFGQSKEFTGHCLESSPSSNASTNETEYLGELTMAPKLEKSASSRASPMLTPPSPNMSWPQSPSRSPQSLYEDAIFNEPETDETPSDKPYAKLIWQAMMETPQKRMTLRQIYDWFKQNTTKPNDSGTNGWQNSIRHNLSMNKAFESEKTETPGPKPSSKKSNNVWVLTNKAIENGVESTTRYRNKGNAKKSSKSRSPAPTRQQSGAKGGKAARRSAKQRQIERDRSAPIKEDPATQLDGSASVCAMFSSSYPVPASPITPVLEDALSYAAPTDHLFLNSTVPDQVTFQTSMSAESTVPTSLIKHSEEPWQKDPWNTEWLSMEQLQQQTWDGLKPLSL